MNQPDITAGDIVRIGDAPTLFKVKDPCWIKQTWKSAQPHVLLHSLHYRPVIVRTASAEALRPVDTVTVLGALTT